MKRTTSIFRALLPASLLLLLPAAIHGQSHDIKHPTPLAPGVNKGNVDNFTGPNYYYFYAGPGRFDVRMAFHEMGIFGNPFRQTLTFTLSNEQGKSLGSNAVVSQGNTATVTNYGTFDKRFKVIVTVTAQQGAVRLGGYYEYEVTGAAAFDGKAGSSAGVTPVDTSLTTTAKNGPVALTKGQTSLTAGQQSLTSSGQTDLTPGTKNGPVSLTSGKPVTLVYPGKALTVQETSKELRIRLAADVLFDFNKFDIRSDAIPTLREAAVKIKAAKPRSPVLVEGYTDAKGTAALNLKLSQQRAESVETWLIQNAGFSVSSFAPKGYGSAHPVAPNQKPDGKDDPAGRQLNRRVELVIAK